MTLRDIWKSTINYVRRYSIRAVLIALFLWALSHLMWDIIAKPGLNGLANVGFNAITLGSTRIRDAAYFSAATDATAVPGLIGFYSLCVAMFGFLGVRIVSHRKTLRMLRLGKTEAQEIEALHPAAFQSKIETLRRWMPRTISFELILIGLIALTALFGFMVINQAVHIRRIFLVNVTRCAPYVTDNEQKLLLARFATVESRADYLPLRSSLDSLARTHNVKLLGGEVW